MGLLPGVPGPHAVKLNAGTLYREPEIRLGLVPDARGLESSNRLTIQAESHLLANH